VSAEAALQPGLKGRMTRQRQLSRLCPRVEFQKEIISDWKSQATAKLAIALNETDTMSFSKLEQTK